MDDSNDGGRDQPGKNIAALIEASPRRLDCLRPCLRHELRPNVAQTEGSWSKSNSGKCVRLLDSQFLDTQTSCQGSNT